MDHRFNRRSFLMGAAAAAGTAWLASGICPVRAANAPSRKEVSIGGKRVKVVDIHAHCVMPQSQAALAGSGLEGEYPKNQILGPDRIARMDGRGIDVQVLSINRYWWYKANPDVAAKVVRAHDEGIAEWVKAHPDRFVGLTSVALQHPELAAEQLEYAVKTLGLRGASVGGYVGEDVPSSPKYDPFWKKAEELQVPVFMHPSGAEAITKENAFEGRGDLGNIVGDPFETTMFLEHLIFDGTLDRFPGLKVCGAHGGGFLPSYLGRVNVACDVRPNAKCLNKQKPADYMRKQIMADCMVFSEEGVRHMVAEMGAGQIVMGSDMPFNWPDMVEILVNAKGISDADKEAILGGNLVRMLKIA